MGDGDFVWAGDDDDSADDGTESAEEANRHPDGDAEPASPFSDLVERVGGPTAQPADLDALVDSLSAEGPSGDREDLERLFERVVGRDALEPTGGSPADPDGVEPSVAGDAAGGLPDTPDGDSRPGSSPTDDGSESPSSLEELFDDDSANAGDGPPDEAGEDDASPFEDLADRVDSDVADRARGGPSAPSGTAGRGPHTVVDPNALPADASGVLVLDDSDAHDSLSCQSLIGRSRPERTNLLLVWLSRDITGRLERLYETYADPSTNVTVVCRSKVGQSFQANPSIPTDAPGGRLSIERISDPRDLPKLGIAISQIVSGWQGHPNRTVMCFDSITNLLQFAEFERVFRFLHVLQGRIDSIDAKAHYHLDRDVHDEQTVTMFWNLFDATVDPTAGEPEDG